MPEGQDKSKQTEDLAAREAAANEALKAELNQLKGRVEALSERPAASTPAEKAPELPKTYTRAELRAMVNAGTITEDQMDEMLETQIEARISARTEKQIEKATRAAKIDANIDAYTAAHPALKDKTTEIYKKVSAEFDYLVRELGDDGTSKATTLKALRNVLGDLSHGASSQGRKRVLEATEEGGGSSEHEEGAASSDDAWAKGIPSALKAHYTKLVQRGLYKGFDDPALKKELDRARTAH